MKSGRFWPGDWKSMKNWPILRTRLNKYESLSILLTRWLKKYENLASEVLQEFHTFSVMCMEHFSCLPNSHTFSVSFSELAPWYCNYNIDAKMLPVAKARLVSNMTWIMSTLENHHTKYFLDNLVHV